MAASGGTEDSAALCDFLDLYLDDRARGLRRPLAEYLRRFPGREEAIAREFVALEAGAVPAAGHAGAPAASPVGEGMLGHYRLLALLGRGGQGAVFLAEDTRLSRRVALKVLDGAWGGLSASRLARLKREAEVLSRLDHPRLCAVYDVDLAGERPYFAMRHVPGETLHQRIDRARGAPAGTPRDREEALLSHMPRTSAEIAAAVRFVEQAARAAHVAHEAGIVHRDLKPGNLMIDTQSEPVVLDFGLARDAVAEDAAITVEGEAFGTPAYMSPEQLSGDRGLDRRTDVYSLGVTLYECLTLRPPFEAATRDALVRAILAGDRRDPRDLNRAVPADLSVVLACALDRDPERRYPTALAFAEDLRRFREREPILARPPGPWTLVRRWAQRHPAAFAGGAATFGLLIVGLVVTLSLLARVTAEQAQTQREKARLSALRQAYLARSLGAEEPAIALRAAVEAARSEPHYEINNILYELLDRCFEERAIMFGAPASYAGLGWDVVADRFGRCVVGCEPGRIATIDLASGAIRDLVAEGAPAGRGAARPPRVAIAPDRSVMASVGEDGAIAVWALDATPRLVASHPPGDADPTCVAFSPDGRRFVTGTRAGKIAIHAVGGGRAPVRCELPGRSVTAAAFSPCGTKVAVTGLAGRSPETDVPAAAVFDVATGARVAGFGSSSALGLGASWSPAGDRLAVAIDSKVVVAETGAFVTRLRLEHADLVYWLAFHPDGRRLVTGSRDGVSVFDPEGGARTHARATFRDRSVIAGAFSPDGSRLAVIAWDETATVLSCDDWSETRKLNGMGRPRAVCWSADAARLLTSDEAGCLHVWYAGERPHLPVFRGHGGRVTGASFHPDGSRVLTASVDGAARVFDATTGRPLLELDHGGPVAAARFAPRGDVAITAGGGRVVAWDAASGARIGALPGPEVARDAWPLRDGRVLAICEDGVARLWRPGDAAPPVELAGHRGPLLCAAIHDGRGIAATGGSDRAVRVWDLGSGRMLAALEYAEGSGAASRPGLSRVFAVAFDREGERVVAGCEDLNLRTWTWADGALRAQPAGPTIGMLALDPASGWLMVASKWTGRVAFHDLDGQDAGPRIAPLQDSHMVSAIAFSPGGEFAIAATMDGSVRIWDRETMRPRAAMNAGCGMILDAALSPDGRSFVVAGSDGTARVWPVDPLPVAERASPIGPEAFSAFRPLIERQVLDR
jgi:WD40 repeat protein/serine/threonine protein kinase